MNREKQASNQKIILIRAFPAKVRSGFAQDNAKNADSQI
ncbi:hypothetical protein CES86_2348 [Brucella lupini]|uniref:Uncharacterized protein n=1 Tax=Brucella lupini TaxID=255457 RepID=A0A256GRH2_9HYPH|nr:hypothetical protein CES86_2348 [Brucella lupini]